MCRRPGGPACRPPPHHIPAAEFLRRRRERRFDHWSLTTGEVVMGSQVDPPGSDPVSGAASRSYVGGSLRTHRVAQVRRPVRPDAGPSSTTG